MNLQEYTEKRVNTVIDFDGRYGHQCVDLIRDYAVNVLGKNFTPSGNAKDLWYQDWGKDYTMHKNTPKFLPKPGDIVIWGGTEYGHIGIVTKASLKEMIILDQNTGSGNGDGRYNNKIRVHTYNYKNVLGFIRHKSLNKKTYEELEQENKYMNNQFHKLKNELLTFIENNFN